MRFSTILVGVALYATISTVLVSCNKEDSFIKSISESESNARLSGVVADDPALVGKVPMIISSDFLKNSKDIPSANLHARGKPDNTLPSVNIVSPANGSTATGTITVQATASDNVKVSLVSFSVDGSFVSSKSLAPYNFPWNSATLPNGIHTIMITAKDGAGNTKSVSIQVTANNVSVGDITKPTVNISSPANGVSISGTVNIDANANDNVGVKSVSYTVDGTSIGSDNTAPYSVPFNTTTVSTGIHTLTATATDAAGNSSSNSIQVTVNTTILPPPVIPLPTSHQLIMPPVTNQGGEGSCAVFSTVYAARSAEQYYKTNASVYNYATNIFSPEFIYNQTKVSDCGSGTGVVTALDLMLNTGVCTWQSMPYSSSNGCDLLPNSSQSAEAANYKIASYSKIAVSDITAIKSMIVNNHALIITVATDNSFWNAQPGFIWKNYSGPMGISHSLVICGYDDAKHAYKVMNSWGTTWGESGFSWIDYDFLPQCSAYYSYVING